MPQDRRRIDYSRLNRLSGMVSQAIDDRTRMELTKLDLLTRRRELERERARQAAIGDVAQRVSRQITSGKQVERSFGPKLGDQFDMTVKEKQPLTEREEDEILLPATAELIGYGEQGIKAGDVLENVIRRRRTSASAQSTYSFGAPVVSGTGTYFSPRENKQTGQVDWLDTRVTVPKDKTGEEDKTLNRQRAMKDEEDLKAYHQALAESQQIEKEVGAENIKKMRDNINELKEIKEMGGLDSDQVSEATMEAVLAGMIQQNRLPRQALEVLRYDKARKKTAGLDITYGTRGEYIDRDPDSPTFGKKLKRDAKRTPRAIDMRDPSKW